MFSNMQELCDGRDNIFWGPRVTIMCSFVIVHFRAGGGGVSFMLQEIGITYHFMLLLDLNLFDRCTCRLSQFRLKTYPCMQERM
jgi:hypothetical protein